MPFIRIKIPQFNTDDLRKGIVKTLDRRGRRNENLLLRTTQFFDTIHPVFQSQVEKVGGDYQVTTGPFDDGDQGSGQIWGFLDQGTDIRYAFMSEDFVAGTTPGTFDTQPKLGQKVGFNFVEPAEGIEARGWTVLLAEEEQPRFAGEVRDTLGKWLKNFSSRASKLISG